MKVIQGSRSQFSLKKYLTAHKTKNNSIMVKGIVNAFDHMGYCLVLNLTTTCTDGKWAVICPYIICYILLPMLVCYQLLHWVASTCYQLRKLISNTEHAMPCELFPVPDSILKN